MSLQSYTIQFSSRGSNVISNANLNSVIYNINWNTVLPLHDYKRYACMFVFKSESYTGTLTNNGFVSIPNIGKTDIFDGTTQVSRLGIIYPVMLGNNYSFYNSTNNDNNPIVIYPGMDSNVTINLNTFAGGAMGNMPHYCLILTLTPIMEDNKIQV